MEDRHGTTARRAPGPVPSAAADTPRPLPPSPHSGELDGAAVAEGWGRIRAGLRRELGARSYDQWLGRARLVSCAEPHWEPVIAVPSPFVLNWIEERHGERIRLAFRTLMPGAGPVRLVVDDRVGATVRRIEPSEAEAAPDLPEAAPSPHAAGRPLDARYTFERFVVGDANRMAANAARALAGGAGTGFSPLFVHSATGQGKTHLAHAIGHALLDSRPDARIECLSAERFTVAFVAAIKAGDTLAFKDRLRAADLLVLDDVQFMAGKGSTQTELLHTLDGLIALGRPVVVTADRPPHLLDGIEPRIRSRLGGGLVADLRPADRALRRAILDAKLEDRASVPGEVLDLLADRVAGSVRELEGALNRLLAYAELNGADVGTAFAADVLADMLLTARRRVTVEEIQERVASHYRLGCEEMLSTRRARAVARPRQIAMYLAKSLTPRSLPDIGRRFGRDHSTVLHAVRTVERLRAEDAELDADVRRLSRELEAAVLG